MILHKRSQRQSLQLLLITLQSNMNVAGNQHQNYVEAAVVKSWMICSGSWWHVRAGPLQLVRAFITGFSTAFQQRQQLHVHTRMQQV
jgi:hypothetical protein